MFSKKIFGKTTSSIRFNQKTSLIRIAFCSRLYLLILQYFGNITIPDHDAGVFQFQYTSKTRLRDGVVHHLLEGFTRWDGQYFLHIAKHGYTYENTMAFFPLFPLVIRYFAYFLDYITISYLDFDSYLLIAGYLINLTFFILSTLTLYDLTFNISNSRHVAYNSAILFCYNPASIFFSSIYSECLFSYLTFKSMLNCYQIHRKDHLNVIDSIYVIPIALGTITRSNGLLNIGFLFYTLLSLYLKKLHLQKKWWKFLIISFIFIVICLSPFIVYQIYCYRMFCYDFPTNFQSNLVDYARNHSLIQPGKHAEYQQDWCNNYFILPYSYVQKHYWNVGFLNYYEWKQIPNFLLASPIIYYTLKDCLKYLQKFPNIWKLFDFNNIIFIYVLHGLFLCVSGLLFFHIQIITRMLCSSSPIIYWFASESLSSAILHEGDLLVEFHTNLKGRHTFIVFYFICYYFIGTVVFCNFLPWT